MPEESNIGSPTCAAWAGVSRPGRAAAVAGLVFHCISHRDLPARGVRRYRRDAVVEKKMADDLGWGGKRGEVKEFSFQARMRLLHLARNCQCDFASMATLTYPATFPGDGGVVKRHLDAFKKWLARRVPGILGIWFLEFQRRGAPHFHILLDLDLASQGDLVCKRRTRLAGHRQESYETCQAVEDDFSRAWYRIVASGDERHLRAGVCVERLESSDAAMRYAACHAAKPRQKEVPLNFLNVGRFWGRLGAVRLVGGEDLDECDTTDIIQEFGPDAVSTRGRVKRYLWGQEKSDEPA